MTMQEETRMDATAFVALDAEELEMLRGHLLRIGPDYCGASEVIRAFLNGRGFGISPEAARWAAVEFGRQGCTMLGMAQVLSRAAQAN